MIGHAELAGLTVDERLDRRDELDSFVTAWPTAHDPQAATAQLQVAGVAAHAAQNSPECATDPQLLHRGWATTVPHALLGPVAVGVPPIRLSRTPARVDHAAPTLGEQTIEILATVLGYDDDCVAELAVAGVLL